VAVRAPRRSGGRALLGAALVLTGAAGSLNAAQPAPSSADRVPAMAIDAIPIAPDALKLRGPGSDCSLKFEGGLVLRSTDERFGGWSGLDADPRTGELVAVSDFGVWLTARLRRDSGGQLIGLDAVASGQLTDAQGAPLAGKLSGDAESIRFDGPDRVLVSFERRHRIDAFEVTRQDGSPRVTGPAHPVETPEGFQALEPNSGIEALAVLGERHTPGGWLLSIAEAGPNASPGTPAWVRVNGGWTEGRYSPKPLYRPTDAVALRDGSVIVLERKFDPLRATVAMRLAQLDVRSILTAHAGQRLRLPKPRTLCIVPPQPLLDNMEAIATIDEDGSSRLLVLSDDNRSPLQKTVLLEFRIVRAP
jgi:hypothetical protein